LFFFPWIITDYLRIVCYALCWTPRTKMNTVQSLPSCRCSHLHSQFFSSCNDNIAEVWQKLQWE
jgi:hypothetical protein